MTHMSAHACACANRRCVFDWGVSPYISASAGWGSFHAWPTPSFWINEHSGMVFSGAIGLEFDVDRSFNLRTELEFIRDSSSRETSHEFFGFQFRSKETLVSELYMLNVFIDLFSNWRISPYIGMGAGTGKIINRQEHWQITLATGDTIYNRGEHISPAQSIVWGLYAGLGIDITRSLTLDIGGRLMGMTSAFFNPELVGIIVASRPVNINLVNGHAGLRGRF